MNTDSHLAGFLEVMQVRRYSNATIYNRMKFLKKFFTWLEGTGIRDLREVSPQTVREFQAQLLTRHTVLAVHGYLSALRRFFEYLESTDVLLVNPCENVPLPRRKDRLPRSILSHEQVRRILEAPDQQTKKGIRDLAILETFYSTGLRLEEMARLTIDEVDADRGFVRVNRGKGGKDRVVPLGAKACEAVSRYLRQVRAEWIADQRDERALWLAWVRGHRPIKKQVISLMVRQYAKRAGITQSASPHVWRHTCATHLVSSGANIAYAQRLLGHRNLSTTQIYTRVSIPELKATHARSHPRKSLSRQQTIAASALSALPTKLRPPYHYQARP